MANLELWASSQILFSMSALTPPLSSSHQFQGHTWPLCSCKHKGCCFWVPGRSAQGRCQGFLRDKWSEQHFNGLELQGISATRQQYILQNKDKRSRPAGDEVRTGTQGCGKAKCWELRKVCSEKSRILECEASTVENPWLYHSRTGFLVSSPTQAWIERKAQCLLSHSNLLWIAWV